MREIGAAAAARFGYVSGSEVVTNLVNLPDGRVVRGTRLMRGNTARHAATEIASRISSRGGDISRIVTDGDLIYIASASETERREIFRAAMTLLAQGHAGTATLDFWLRAAYLLFQAPRKKRGADATIRTFLIAAGACLLEYLPRLIHDIDLLAYVQTEAQFVDELRTAQDSAGSLL
ncbi:hypothetical protein [Pseudofrankia asymbiotica]|uniref:Uncharacterized protein n=1 Tax=Pseudofrankia asymbiotica TaxID=1834516 RepID=A0A1V2I5L4_9ACTN|nr:hypothetical protein [Pseudofrankia asymbiotica]ONH26548.1 hypothetical protein BL253_24075 [Pseudofrankia asymbiotica]